MPEGQPRALQRPAPRQVPPAGSAPHRYDGIQALRLVAALLVVGTHATLYTRDRLDSSFPIWHFGEIGVPIFFVISGFVMYAASHRGFERPGYWKTFAIRRAIRVVPMYWIATTCKLATLVAVPGMVLHAQLDPGQVLASYGFVPWVKNSSGIVEPLLGVGWTLIFEVFFYAVFTVVLLARVPVVPALTAVMSLCALGVLVRGDDWPPALVYLNPIVLYFLVGVFIGRWAVSGRGWAAARGIGWALLVWGTIWVVAGRAHGARLDDLLTPLVVTAVVVVAVATERSIGRRLPRVLVAGGDASYSLYLFHPLIAPLVPVVLSRIGITSPAVSVAGVLLVALVAAVLVHRCVERPATRVLQEKLLPVRG